MAPQRASPHTPSPRPGSPRNGQRVKPPAPISIPDEKREHQKGGGGTKSRWRHTTSTLGRSKEGVTSKGCPQGHGKKRGGGKTVVGVPEAREGAKPPPAPNGEKGKRQASQGSREGGGGQGTTHRKGRPTHKNIRRKKKRLKSRPTGCQRGGRRNGGSPNIAPKPTLKTLILPG